MKHFVLSNFLKKNSHQVLLIYVFDFKKYHLSERTKTLDYNKCLEKNEYQKTNANAHVKITIYDNIYTAITS